MEMCKQGQHIEKQTANTRGKLDLDHRKQNVQSNLPVNKHDFKDKIKQTKPKNPSQACLQSYTYSM